MPSSTLRDDPIFVPPPVWRSRPRVYATPQARVSNRIRSGYAALANPEGPDAIQNWILFHLHPVLLRGDQWVIYLGHLSPHGTGMRTDAIPKPFPPSFPASSRIRQRNKMCTIQKYISIEAVEMEDCSCTIMDDVGSIPMAYCLEPPYVPASALRYWTTESCSENQQTCARATTQKAP